MDFNINIGGAILVFAAVILIIYIIFKLLKLSVKLFVKLLLNSLIGAVLLFAFNFIFYSVLHIENLYIPINRISAAITGIFGVPGVVLMLIYKLFVK